MPDNCINSNPDIIVENVEEKEVFIDPKNLTLAAQRKKNLAQHDHAKTHVGVHKD